MLLGHLGPAHGEAFQAALLDEGGGEVTRRPLEHGAGAGVFQGLLLLPPPGQIVHAAADGGGVVRLKVESCPQNDPLPVGKCAAAVGEPALLRRDRLHAAPPGGGDLLHHLDHLAPVGAGVHQHAAPQGTRDAVGKLQAGQPLLGGKRGQPGQRHPRPGPDLPLSRPLQGVQAGEQHREARDLPVRRQQIGAVAQHHQPDLGPLRLSQAGEHLPLAAGQGHQPHRAADAEGGVAGHGLMLSQFQGGAGLSQRRRQLFKPLHRTSK